MSEAPSPRPPVDPILDEVRRFYGEHHEGIERSRRRHRYYRDDLTRILRVRVRLRFREGDVAELPARAGSPGLLTRMNAFPAGWLRSS